jgi:trimethylamine--corrinoid protein Co-methyltransferase
VITSVLTDAQIVRVNEASLAILQRVGVHLPHAEALRLFEEAGATVDHEAQRVRIPADLVRRCVAQAGKEFTLTGRDESRTARFGQGCRNYNSIAGEALWVDELGTPRRYCRLEDVTAAARLGDALAPINVVGAMADPQELPPAARCVAVVAELLRNTTKPITFWYHDRASARYVNEIMVAVRGSEEEARARPLAYPFLEPISPLRFPHNGVDLLFETGKLGLPVPVGPMAQMGLSAPGTVAGTLAQENAEILAGVCVVQLISPGIPVVYGGICHAFDMRTTQLIFSGPEQALFGVALTQIGKGWGLPVYINVGLTDSKVADAQAGLEAGVTLAMGAAAGADIFGHLGISGVDQAASLDMLVLQAEIVRYVESTLREIDFSDAAFGLEVIEEVGPGGRFLDQIHTARRFRKELWFPDLLDRYFYDQWLLFGATTLEQRCRMRREELLAAHVPVPLPDDVEREIARIVAAAQRHLAGEPA